MKAKRLMIVFLILLLTLPLTALAEKMLVDVRIEYQEGVNPETNEPVGIPWPGAFAFDFEDPQTQSGLWIQLLSGDAPTNSVRIILVYYDTDSPDGQVEYVLTDGYSQWLDMSASELMPGQYYMQGVEDGTLYDTQMSVVMSTNPMGGDDGGDGGDSGDGGDGNGGDNEPFYEALPDGHTDHVTPNQNDMPFYSNLQGVVLDWLSTDAVLMLNTDPMYPSQHDEGGYLWVPVKLLLEDSEIAGYVMLRDVSFMSQADEATFVQARADRAAQKQREAEEAAEAARKAQEEADALAAQKAKEEAEAAEAARKAQEEADALAAKKAQEEADALAAQKAKEEADAAAKKAQEEADAAKKAEELEEIVDVTPDTAKYAQVLPNVINVRKGASKGSEILTNLSKNDYVLVTELIKGTDGSQWYHVTLANNQQGYIQADADPSLLHVLTEEEENKYLADLAQKAKDEQDKQNQQNQQQNENNNNNNNTDNTNTGNNTPPLTQTTGYMKIVNTNYAAIRVLPDYGSQTLDFLANGDIVYVTGQQYDASQTVIFSYTTAISTTKSAGFVEAQYLKAMTTAEVTAYYASLNKPTPTVPTAVPSASPTSFSGYAMLTRNDVNFRNSASGTSGVINRLAKGTVVRVVSEKTAEGYTWFYCESGGTYGYLRGDMLALLSIREYQLIGAAPSYSQNGSIITPTTTASNSSSSGGANATTWTTPKPGATSGITFVTLPPMASASPSPDPSASASASPDPFASASPDPSASGDLLAAGTTPTPNPGATLPPDTATEFPEESGGFSAGGLLAAVGVLLALGGGGLYGYSVYNKSRRQQAEAQVKQLSKDGQQAGGERPAVRRPVPPTDGKGTAASAAGVAGVAGAQQQGRRTAAQQQGQAQRPAQSGQPGQAQRPAQPGQPGQPNPYARPQSAPTGARPATQDVTSPLPRAQVDGKPVGQTQPQPGTAQQNPYARPGTQQQPMGQRLGTPTTPQQGQPQQRPATQQRPQMPVAPEAVEPDETTKATRPPEGSTNADVGTTTGEAPPRRRRRRPVEEDSSDS